jgi:glycerophosphoryl diester phosphodiesterase
VKAALFLASLALTGCASVCFDCERVAPTGARFLVAHRGAHLSAPENSLEAIREAARLGASYAEVDVRVTWDDAIVLMHDSSIDRTTDGDGPVADLPLAALRAHRLLRRDGTRSGERIPTFAESLEAAKDAGIGLYVDVKTVSPDRLARALEGVDPALVLVYQDEADWLERFHALAPTVPLLPECGSVGEIREAARRYGARAFASGVGRFEPAQAAVAHELGGVMIVDALGEDDGLVERAASVLRSGADAVQTDDPARVKSLLASR